MQVGDVGVGVGAGGGRNADIGFDVSVSVGGSGGVRHGHGGGNGEESGHGAACVHICMLTCILCGICKHRFQSNIGRIPKTCMIKSGLILAGYKCHFYYTVPFTFTGIRPPNQYVLR